MSYSQEFLTHVKEIIKNKLIELNALADEELPDYITVMVANKKKRSSMKKDLRLFLGDDTDHFTEWLHNVIDSKSQEKSKKDKSKKSHRSETASSRTRNEVPRSPVTPRKSSSGAEVSEDFVNVQTDENEFMDEFSTENKSESKPREQRRVVATKSLKDNSGQKFSEEKPLIRSIVKVSTEKVEPVSSSTNSPKPVLPSAGSKLLKLAVDDVKTQEKQAAPRALKRSLDRRGLVPASQSTASQDSGESEIPQKVTKFVVTMSEESLIGLKPSVKSRLGPRVVARTTDSLSDSSGLIDAREILVARKTGLTAVVANESENTANENLNESLMESKKHDRSSVPSSLQRCKYWPNCRNQEICEFFHPKEECKSFPNCRYGVRCLYIHPPCRYGAQCSRPDCAFTHTGQVEVVPSPPTAKVACRYYPHCKMPPGTCPFFHPPTPMCRFGAACLNRATTCPFMHPSLVAIPTANKLKWVAPGKSPGSALNQSKQNNVSSAAEAASTISANGPALVQSSKSAEIIST